MVWPMPKAFPAYSPAPSQTAESVLISLPGAEVLETQEPPVPAMLRPLPPLVWCQPDFSSGMGHLIHDWPPASLRIGWLRFRVLFQAGIVFLFCLRKRKQNKTQKATLGLRDAY